MRIKCLVHKGFALKLALLSRQMGENNFCHFTLLKTEDVLADCAEKVDVLKEEFERRFSELKRIEPEFNLLTFPFAANVN